MDATDAQAICISRRPEQVETDKLRDPRSTTDEQDDTP